MSPGWVDDFGEWHDSPGEVAPGTYVVGSRDIDPDDINREGGGHTVWTPGVGGDPGVVVGLPDYDSGLNDGLPRTPAVVTGPPVRVPGGTIPPGPIGGPLGPINAPGVGPGSVGTGSHTGVPGTPGPYTRAGVAQGSALNRLVVENVASNNELRILNYLRQARGARGATLQDVQGWLADPSYASEVAEMMGMNVLDVQNVFGKVLSTGISGILMALTGNFPLAAMGYFATDKLIGGANQVPFAGWPGGAWADGTLVLPMGMPVPDGLPNEIFNDFRFVCYDRLGQRWWPTDEIRPLSYDGGNYRWLCLDRVEGRLYKCNWIKKPTIYI